MTFKHREAAFAFIRCGSDLFIATSRRNGEELNPPGGKCECGDKDPLATAIREVYEECGIRLRSGLSLPYGPHALGQTEHAHHFLFDLPRIPANFRQREAGIKVAAVPLYVFKRSQYYEFNRFAIQAIEEQHPRPSDLVWYDQSRGLCGDDGES